MRKSVSKDKVLNSTRSASKKDLAFHTKNLLNTNTSRNKFARPINHLTQVDLAEYTQRHKPDTAQINKMNAGEALKINQYKRSIDNKVLTETPRNLANELKAVNSSIRKNLKQSRNKQIKGKIDIAHTMKLLDTKGSIQIIKTDMKSPMTRNIGKAVFSKQLTANEILDCNSLNEAITKSLQPGAKLILKNMKKMLDETERHKKQRKSKKLSNITMKIKDIIDKYKERETLLINENRKLRAQVKHLTKTLAVYEMFT